MRSTTLGLLAFSLLLLTTSCASIVGKRNANVLEIRSEPPGATVSVNGAEVGQTPYTLTYAKELEREVLVELRMEGYEPMNATVRVKEQGGVLFADAMLLGIPYIFDSGDPRLYKFQVGRLDLQLRKQLPSDLQRIELPVVQMVSAVPKGPVGTIGTRKISTTSKEMADLAHTEWCTSSLLRGLKGGWADAAGARPGTQAGDERIRRAKFHLQPTLKALRIDVDEHKGRLDGTVELDMLWSFISAFRKDSVLFSVPKTTRVPVSDLPAREIITAPLEVAARQLLEDVSVHEALTKAFNAGLVASKGDVVELKTPVPITFTGRKDMLGALVKGVVTLETSDGHGSGFMITNDGHLLTNAHVVGNDTKVKVRFEQGFALDGQVLKVNRDFDLALVHVPGTDLPAIALGDDAQLQLGEEIFAIGTPLDKQFGQTVTRGIMSGRREIEGRSYLQTDVSINPGNSGGPLIDEGGRAVGVATLKITANGVEGIGFGVPINKALEMLNIRFVP